MCRCRRASERLLLSSTSKKVNALASIPGGLEYVVRTRIRKLTSLRLLPVTKVPWVQILMNCRGISDAHTASVTEYSLGSAALTRHVGDFLCLAVAQNGQLAFFCLEVPRATRRQARVLAFELQLHPLC